MTAELTLHGYFRSSAAYRVRIALGLKSLPFESIPVHLVRGGGMQRSAAYASLNPEKLVPTLVAEGQPISQSLAILEYLEERFPEPALLPARPADRAWVRAVALQLACDVHPLNNLRVLQYLEGTLGVSPGQKLDWIRHWTALGFQALETRLARDGHSGSCCFGDAPTLADCCLVPQVFSARRFELPMDPYPNIERIEAHLAQLPAFAAAAPGVQPDAE